MRKKKKEFLTCAWLWLFLLLQHCVSWCALVPPLAGSFLFFFLSSNLIQESKGFVCFFLLLIDRDSTMGTSLTSWSQFRGQWLADATFDILVFFGFNLDHFFLGSNWVLFWTSTDSFGCWQNPSLGSFTIQLISLLLRSWKSPMGFFFTRTPRRPQRRCGFISLFSPSKEPLLTHATC